MSPKPNPLTRGKKQKARALLRHNQLAEAKPLLEQICHADRRDTETWYLLAAVNQQLGALEEAAEAYRQVAVLDPRHAEAHYYLGNTYLALGNAAGAAACFEQALRIRPDYLEAHINLGGLHELRDNHLAAETSFREALRLDPQNAELIYNLGNTLQAQKKIEAAVELYHQALALRPQHADTHNNLGNALAQIGRFDDAIACYQQALMFTPTLVAAHNNMGNTYLRMQRIDDAIASYEQALRLQPDYAEALTNLGNLRQRRQGKLDVAIALHRHAIECSPEYADAHYNLAFCLLLKGDFREGWREYDWRWMREGGMRRPLPVTPWDGADLGGRRVFIHAEQGLGDEIFFLRFVLQLRHKGAGHIIYRPTTKIAPLLSRVQVIDHLAGSNDQPNHTDLVCSVGDLPQLLGPESDNLTPPSLTIPVSAVEVERTRHVLATLGPPPYVGVTWRAGSQGSELVLYKESPLTAVAQALRDIPATVLILQRHPLEGEVTAFSQALGRPVHDLSALNEDLEQVLALLALIDDYIGVSNTNMHLRAGVGKTARVLVPAPPEWRWMAEGKESPWFPGFSVYRQGYDGDWTKAFAELVKDLAQ